MVDRYAHSVSEVMSETANAVDIAFSTDGREPNRHWKH
jgi:hypothetical protein